MILCNFRPGEASLLFRILLWLRLRRMRTTDNSLRNVLCGLPFIPHCLSEYIRPPSCPIFSAYSVRSAVPQTRKGSFCLRALPSLVLLSAWNTLPPPILQAPSLLLLGHSVLISCLGSDHPVENAFPSLLSVPCFILCLSP